MTRRTYVIALAISVLATGCGAKATAPAPSLQVGGDYDVLKTEASNTCGPVGGSISTPASVTHQAGATTFAIVDHGTRSLPGQVARNGTMTMDVVRSTVMGTIAASDTFTNGRFTASGFDLTVTTDLADNPNRPGTGSGPCRIVTTWRGAKLGSPNVIPE